MKAITETGLAVQLASDGTWTLTKTGQELPREGFRKTVWGSPKSQAKAAEGREPREEQDDYLDFEVSLGRFRCLAAYIFVGNQLVRGKYVVLEEYQNQTNYLTVYAELKDSVSKKYGSPIKDETYWLNDLYKDDYSEWGMAVGCGHLSKFASWKTPESTINVGLFGENFDVHVTVEYAGNAFDGVEDSVKEADLLSDL